MNYLLINNNFLTTIELIKKDNKLQFRETSNNFYIPLNVEEINQIRYWLESLQNGKLIYCRGRDIIRNNEGIFESFSNWEYGYALKMNRRLFFLWDNDVESIMIDGCNFLDQLHFECFESLPIHNRIEFNNRVLMVCHGFCFDYGPNYPFVAALTSALSTIGYRVLIPDFRPSYKYGPARGRSERIRIAMDEIVSCMGEFIRDQYSQINSNNNNNNQEPLSFVLIGHSQGGAAVGQLCGSEKTVLGANIKGIVMMGSESPVESLATDMNALLFGGIGVDDPEQPYSPPVLIHTTRPASIPPENILCIHSYKDRVIHHAMIQQLAERWECRYVELHSNVIPDHPSVEWADDIQHDFIAKDLLLDVIEMTSNFVYHL